MIECFPRWRSHFPLWEQARSGKPDWEAIFEGFSATVDFPACTSWRELSDYYPDSKVILGVREPADWVESTQQTIFQPAWIEWLAGSEGAGFMDATINSYFDGRMHDRDHLAERFEQHVKDVQENVPEDRLLTFNVKEGWEPLCDFLGVAVPDGPFPRVNDTEATREIIRHLMENGFGGVFPEDANTGP